MAKLLLDQLWQVAIAERLGVSPATISRDVRAINRELMEAEECPVCGSPYVPWVHKMMYPALYDDFVEPERAAGNGAVSTGQVGKCAASQDDAATGEAPEATPLPTVKELEERRRAIMGKPRRRRPGAEKAPDGLDAMAMHTPRPAGTSSPTGTPMRAGTPSTQADFPLPPEFRELRPVMEAMLQEAWEEAKRLYDLMTDEERDAFAEAWRAQKAKAQAKGDSDEEANDLTEEAEE